MCKLIDLQLSDRVVRVADIKAEYIKNIVDSVKLCDYIEKVVLFGSSIDERCTEEPDIDIAVFGNVSEYRCLRSKKYKDFSEAIYKYNGFEQTYDILYFESNRVYNDNIMKDIEHGEVIYG